MKWFRRFCQFLEYGPFFAALLPTLLVLLAAGLILAEGQGAAALTTPAIPIYRAG
jgi:hypothetical protein